VVLEEARRKRWLPDGELSERTARPRSARFDWGTDQTRVNISIPVSDQDQALEFYLDKLGFEKRRDVPLPQFGGRWIEVAPSDAAVTIALVPAREDAPTGVQTGIRLTTADAEGVHVRLQERGVDVGELLRWPGVRPMFALLDQDGNGLEIVQAN
jgi:catechol 2,3-dioxygenase-like lactoylglutathione lyase family enzyme